MNNIINITFLEEALDTHLLGIVITGFGNTALPKIESFIFTPRTSLGKIQVYDPSSGGTSPYTGIVGEYTAEKFLQFFLMDYNRAGLITGSRTGNVVTLQIAPGWNFEVPFNEASPPDSTEALDITYTFGQSGEGFSFDDFVYSASSSPCTHINIDAHTNNLIDKIYKDGVEISSNVNSSYFASIAPRGIPFKYLLTDYVGGFLSVPTIGTTGFYLLSSDNIAISLTPTPTGTTVTFNYIYTPINGFVDPIFEWSLDGVTYESSNVLTGQPEGDYTVYMRDQFGCVKTKEYSTQNTGFREAYHYVSIANSINYVNANEVRGCAGFINQDNSFNFQALNEFGYCQDLLFTTCDNIRTQLKTNYSNILVTLRKESSPDVVIPTMQRSANLDRFQSMDCVIYEYSDGYTGVYFDSGQTYDELGFPIGTYELNGNLPAFAKTGNLVDITGQGGFIIEDVLFDENIQKNVIIVQNNFVSSPEVTQIKSTFDLLDFEIHEFDIDFSIYGEGLYDVVILLQDDNYDDVYYISENILVQETHRGTLAIRYYNENNKDIFYKYGIEHFIRIPYLDIQQGVEDESVINIGDYVSDLVSSKLNIKDKYTFDALPSNIRTKLIIALSCKNLFIQNIGYIKKSNVDIEFIENTNLGYVFQDLIRTNVNYNTNINRITVTEGLPLNFPRVITDGTNFIKE